MCGLRYGVALHGSCRLVTAVAVAVTYVLSHNHTHTVRNVLLVAYTCRHAPCHAVRPATEYGKRQVINEWAHGAAIDRRATSDGARTYGRQRDSPDHVKHQDRETRRGCIKRYNPPLLISGLYAYF